MKRTVDEVDSEAVSIFGNCDFQKLRLTALAYVAKLKHFCDNSPSDNTEHTPPSTTISEDLQAASHVRERRKKLLDMLRRSKRSSRTNPETTNTAGRPKKRTRTINIGMRVLNERKRDKDGWRIAKSIKAPLGDKNCIVMEFSLDSTYETLKTKIESALFVKGNNSLLGNATDYDLEVVNGRNENLNDNLSCSFNLGNYIEEKRIPGAIRFYLLCSPRSLVSDTDGNSDSDTILPEFDLGTPSGEILLCRRTRNRSNTSPSASQSNRSSTSTSSTTVYPSTTTSSSELPLVTASSTFHLAFTSKPPVNLLTIPPPSTVHPSTNTSQNTADHLTTSQEINCPSVPSTSIAGYNMQRDYAELIKYSDSKEEFQAAIQASLSETVSTGRMEKGGIKTSILRHIDVRHWI